MLNVLCKTEILPVFFFTGMKLRLLP